MKCKKSFKKLFAILMVYFFSLSLVPFNFLGQAVQAAGNEIPTYSNFTPFYLLAAYQYKDKTLLYGDTDFNVKEPKKLMLKEGDNYKTLENNFPHPRYTRASYTDNGMVFSSSDKTLLYDYESDSLTEIDEKSIIENVVKPSLNSALANDHKDYFIENLKITQTYVKHNGDILYVIRLNCQKGDFSTTFNYLIDSKGKVYYNANLPSMNILDVVGDKILIREYSYKETNYLLYDGNSAKKYSRNSVDRRRLESSKLTKDGNLAYIGEDFTTGTSYFNIAIFDDKTESIIPYKTMPISSNDSLLCKDSNDELWIYYVNSENYTELYKIIDENPSLKYKFKGFTYDISIYDDNNLVVFSYDTNDKGSYVSITNKVEEPSDLDLKLKTAHESTLGVMKKASSHGVKAYFDAKDGGISDTDNVVAAVKDGLQKDILKTREAINVLPDDGGTFTNARETFSSILDNYQHPIYERIVTVINEHTEKENPTQKDLNGLRYLIQDIPNLDYKATWSTDIDELQGILFNKARTLVEKALESKLEIDIENAKKAIAELEENEFLTEDINTLISELKGKLGLN
ncbi:hypothetical protein KQI89_12025 [Clostridium sp. MSJ-4]|uniref:Uncharacterized protein n=1 Tax=Clostridium simiarum TaxID=2841506 RepID=A0ABS6F1T7_9CLOT|nr:hypothetical protein [Clostridium simiarum]MBU5592482.1 hypothetical protein [Clostridium simiarum]